MSTPKYELKETDHGIDGWDAKTKLVARFDTKELAEAWLAKREYNHKEYGAYSHADPNKRHCMGKISYTIMEDPQVPENPQ